MNRLFCGTLTILFCCISLQVLANELQQSGELEIKLTEEKSFLYVIHEGRSVMVQRVQDPEFVLKGYYAKTARKCPPLCPQPMKTVGEVELFDFMEMKLRDSKGLLIDARTPEWHERGTIPGSINVPFTILSKAGTTQNDDALKLFGARPRGKVSAISLKLEKMGIFSSENKTEKWDFSHAKDLVLWCNRPECGQSSRAIKGFLNLGYPADKIFCYRGGSREV